jgi:hypothetical protein
MHSCMCVLTNSLVNGSLEHWRVLDRQPELKGQRLILLVDWDSHTVIKETGYKIFTGLTQGTIKVLRYPEAGLQQEGAARSPASTESVASGEQTAMPPPPPPTRLRLLNGGGQQRRWKKRLQL